MGQILLAQDPVLGGAEHPQLHHAFLAQALMQALNGDYPPITLHSRLIGVRE